MFFPEAPPLYLILWNHNQVSGWIDDILTHEDYDETLVLEIMQPVAEDKQVGDSVNIQCFFNVGVLSKSLLHRTQCTSPL